MRRSVLAVFLFASPAFADPGIDEVLAHLRAEDPGVRAAARDALLQLGAAASRMLGPEYRPFLRAIVEGAPGGDEEAAWREWGKLGVACFSWNPESRRWEVRR